MNPSVSKMSSTSSITVTRAAWHKVRTLYMTKGRERQAGNHSLLKEPRNNELFENMTVISADQAYLGLLLPETRKRLLPGAFCG